MIQVFAVRGQVLWRYSLEELNVLIVMEPAHVMSTGTVRPIDFHFVVETIVQYQTVYDRQTVWLHGVCRPIVEIAHVGVVKVKHPLIRHIDGSIRTFQKS